MITAEQVARMIRANERVIEGLGVADQETALFVCATAFAAMSLIVRPEIAEELQKLRTDAPTCVVAWIDELTSIVAESAPC